MRRLRRFLVACCLGVLVLVLPFLAAAVRLTGEVDRFPGAFAGLERRPAQDAGPVDVLVVTTYGVGGRSGWLPRGRRAASLMVVHVNQDRRGGAVVGLPLDARVSVPGRGERPLRSVFRLGGPALAVATVEGLTSTRIDQVAVVDWHVFERLTARLGGIQLALDRREVGPVSPSTGVVSGYVDGDDVRAFVTEPGIGPVRRLHRELIVLDEIMRGSLHQELRMSPVALYRFLDIAASHLAVDDSWSGWDMTWFAASQWRLRSADIRYATAPLTCSRPRRGCRVALDKSAAPAFWRAVRSDRIGPWLAAHDLRGAANVQRLGLDPAGAPEPGSAQDSIPASRSATARSPAASGW